MDPHGSKDHAMTLLLQQFASPGPAENASKDRVSRMVGIVVIGRNEGERLHRALASARDQTEQIVYVDSGSNDASVAWARERGVETVELDANRPFTAARARNAGFARLLARWPDIGIVQFIDGDCELAPGWVSVAFVTLMSRPDLAIVFGRRRERFRDATVYNRLCDMEWDGAPGFVQSCGGDSAMRVEALRAVGGFRETLIAGEEPDLCHRLRRDGWLIERIADDMTVHDASMTRWQQLWQRNRRSGFAGAEAWRLRGREDPRLFRSVLSNIMWAIPPAWPLWPVLWLRVARRSGGLYATHIMLGKVPHAVGQLEYWLRPRSERHIQLIEYK